MGGPSLWWFPAIAPWTVPRDSNQDVMLPLGNSLLWDTARVGDRTKGARVLLLVLGTFNPSYQVDGIVRHVKFVQDVASLPGLAN